MTSPPVALEAHILSVLLSGAREYAALAVGFLDAEDFCNSPNSDIFKAVTKLYSAGQGIDMLSVLHEGDRMFTGAHLVDLMQETAATSRDSFQQKMMILKEYRVKRDLIGVLQDARDLYIAGPKFDVFEAIDGLHTSLKRISPSGSAFGAKGTRELLEEVAQEALKSAQEKSRGVLKSGFAALDMLIGGMRSGDLVVLASRPSMGKTAFALSMALKQIASGIGVGFFSLEMSEKSLLVRAVSQMSRISTSRLQYASLSGQEQSEIINQLENTPYDYDLMPIDDTAGLTIPKMRSRLDQWKSKYGIKMAIVDYMQLMTPSSKAGNREQEISEISRSMKLMAKEFDITLIALSQLSRQAESAERPRLSHLRESGAIEQDADIVEFLYRPEYYGHETYSDGESTSGIGEVIVAKNRQGAVGVAKLGFHKERTQWYDLEDESEMVFHDPFNQQ